MKVSTFDRPTLSVGLLGLAFMLMFTSFQTQGNMQVSVYIRLPSHARLLLDFLPMLGYSLDSLPMLGY